MSKKHKKKKVPLVSEHDPETVLLYFTADYAGYKISTSENIASPSLADWFIERGVALKHDLGLEKIADEVIGNTLRLVRTKSEEERSKLFIAVRYMISDEEELGLFRFFNTEYEPHFKIVRDFVTHEWFTDEEKAYLESFIRKHFIERKTIRHQISALTRIKKREIRLARMNPKQPQ
ncbi:MAG: hypothetical protein Q8O53_03685 [Candidatus Moranbacteria bacterium]|nr:hypothetical protein [Candidatus Moranbacteria bacterium]